MGFLDKLTGPKAPEEPSRAGDPAHEPQRKLVLGGAIINEVGSLPIVGEFGDPLPNGSLPKEAVDSVLNRLSKEPSMAASIAHQTLCMVFELTISQGSEPSDTRLVYQSMGTSPGEPLASLATSFHLTHPVMFEFYPRPSDQDRSAIRELLTGDPVGRRAAELSAWASIGCARMGASGKSNLPWPLQFNPPGPLTDAAWYPNPYNSGPFDAPRREASIQRWHDGSDWSERVRIWDRGRWHHETVPMNEYLLNEMR